MTQKIGHLQKQWVICWGQVFTPQHKGSGRVFGCVETKPLVYVGGEHPSLDNDRNKPSFCLDKAVSSAIDCVLDNLGLTDK